MYQPKSELKHAVAAWQDDQRVRDKLFELFDSLINHPGFGELHIGVKILRGGKKEIILSSGKQYRFVLHPVSSSKSSGEGGTASK